MSNVEFFEMCIRCKDFFALVYFICDKCKTEEELIEVCRNAHNITLDMITDLINSAIKYMNDSTYALEAAQRMLESDVLSNESKEKLNEFIRKEISSTTIMGYKLRYFIQVIEKEIQNQEN